MNMPKISGQAALPENEQVVVPGYKRTLVAAEDASIFALMGIDRATAFELVQQNLGQDLVRRLIQKVIQELLIVEKGDFRNFLHARNLFPQNADLSTLESRRTFSYSSSTQIAFLRFDILEREIGSEWPHPATMHVLAYLKGLKLHIWKLADDSQSIIQYPLEDYDAEYSALYSGLATGSQNRKDLLWISSNHFESLELVGFKENIPDDRMVPYTIETYPLLDLVAAANADAAQSQVLQVVAADNKEDISHAPQELTMFSGQLTRAPLFDLRVKENKKRITNWLIDLTVSAVKEAGKKRIDKKKYAWQNEVVFSFLEMFLKDEMNERIHAKLLTLLHQLTGKVMLVEHLLLAISEKIEEVLKENASLDEKKLFDAIEVAFKEEIFRHKSTIEEIATTIRLDRPGLEQERRAYVESSEAFSREAALVFTPKFFDQYEVNSEYRPAAMIRMTSFIMDLFMKMLHDCQHPFILTFEGKKEEQLSAKILIEAALLECQANTLALTFHKDYLPDKSDEEKVALLVTRYRELIMHMADRLKKFYCVFEEVDSKEKIETVVQGLMQKALNDFVANIRKIRAAHPRSILRQAAELKKLRWAILAQMATTAFQWLDTYNKRVIIQQKTQVEEADTEFLHERYARFLSQYEGWTWHRCLLVYTTQPIQHDFQLPADYSSGYIRYCDETAAKNILYYAEYVEEGYYLHLMLSLPPDVTLYKNSYILTRSTNELHYVKPDGAIEVVAIRDFSLFNKKLTSLFDKETTGSLLLSQEQVKDFITSNGKHTPKEKYVVTEVTSDAGVLEQFDQNLAPNKKNRQLGFLELKLITDITGHERSSDLANQYPLPDVYVPILRAQSYEQLEPVTPTLRSSLAWQQTWVSQGVEKAQTVSDWEQKVQELREEKSTKQNKKMQLKQEFAEASAHHGIREYLFANTAYHQAEETCEAIEKQISVLEQEISDLKSKIAFYLSLIKRFNEAKIFALRKYMELNDYPFQVTAEVCEIDGKSIVEYLATLSESHTQRNLLLVSLLNKGVAIYRVRGELHSVFEIIKNTQSIELMAAALAWAKIYEAILNRTNQDGLAQYKAYIQILMNQGRTPSFIRGTNIMDRKINIHLRRSVYREKVQASLQSFCPEFLANGVQASQDKRQSITEKVGSYFNAVQEALNQAEWMGYDNHLIGAVRKFAQICLDHATTSSVCGRYGRALQQLSEPTRELSLISIDKEDPTLVNAQQALAQVLDNVGKIVCMFYCGDDSEKRISEVKEELAERDREIAAQKEELQEKEHKIQEQDQQLQKAKQELATRPTMEAFQSLTDTVAQLQALVMQQLKKEQPQNEEASASAPASASTWKPGLYQ